MKGIVDANTTVPIFRDRLANCQINMATALLRLGKISEARTRCESAVMIRQKLIGEHQNISDYRMKLAECWLRLGQVCQAEADSVRASGEWGRAVDLFKTITNLNGEYVFYSPAATRRSRGSGSGRSMGGRLTPRIPRQTRRWDCSGVRSRWATVTPTPTAPRQPSTRYATAPTSAS